ncbi:GntR family transcriptional regulator [Lactobacillus sp. ESL0791]|uniref:GntR family transcriptional regulator n=1 Tax=Lactobacillus sp. ESL0791 TaxID=2983234 RepID=UPI0023F7EDE8|nr:GntR family transcriptional regulator [Lactobacillus sp. ESL0791]MDF7638318.1 GntR family transcriptional regulator [Lactobacillus sp. ESL0791]
MVKFVDNNSDKPLYDQLKNLLEEKIITDYHCGELLPTERKLALSYDVSRTTVRIALQKLAQEGLVERIQGKGTVVSNFKKIQKINATQSNFAKQMLEQQKKPRMKLLKVELAKYTKELEHDFYMNSENELLKVEQLYCGDDIPVLFEKTYFAYDKFKKIDLTVFEKKSTEEVITEGYSSEAIFVYDKLDIVSAPSTRLIRKLQLKKSCPLLKIERKYLNQMNELISLIYSWARPDMYSYNVMYRKYNNE